MATIVMIVIIIYLVLFFLLALTFAVGMPLLGVKELLHPDSTVLNTLDNTRPKQVKKSVSNKKTTSSRPAVHEVGVDASSATSTSVHSTSSAPQAAASGLHVDLTSALVNLGYKKHDATKLANRVLSDRNTPLSFAQALKLALKA